jgi:hypothetical protein
LLLLDANVVIHLFAVALWDRVVALCDIHVAKTVVDEAHFFEDENSERHDFDLTDYVNAGKIRSFPLDANALENFLAQFGVEYLEKLDAGEVESQAFLCSTPGEWRFCSADKIVFRVLGNLDRSGQGISLEEILQKVGLGRNLEHPFTKAYRERWTAKGVEERLQGDGLRKPE